MGEIDSRSIEPVQVAVTLFGEQGDHQKKQLPSRHTSGKSREGMGKEKDVDNLLRELTNFKVQLEAKDSAYLESKLSLEHYQKTAEELSIQRKNSELERDACMEELTGARYRICELESKVQELDDQLLGTEEIREQLSCALCKLKSAQAAVMSMETELAGARDERLMALTKAEVMESAAAMEKERVEQLLNYLAELNETIFKSKLDVAEEVKEKVETSSKKDSKAELATKRARQTQKQVEEMKKQVEDLKNQLMEKSLFIDSMQMNLDKALYDARNDMEQLKADLKSKEEENSEQVFYIEALKTEQNRLQFEVKGANDKARIFKIEGEMLATELKKTKNEMSQIKERDNEAQVEIALLKSKLHRTGTQLAAAKAVEARAVLTKSSLEEPQYESPSQIAEESEVEVERHDKNHGNITISLEEYDSLIRKAEKDDRYLGEDPSHSTSEIEHEVEILKKELQIAMTKIMDLRTRSEHAVTRAEAVEKAKASLDDQINQLRDRKQRRRAALASLRQESSSKETSIITFASSPKKCVPLSEFLNIKL
ncbi:hypothetical protein K2173_019717 [Erythroxylum novogranatense]|uniref:Uncharacterized protein n=1 Tax=Erythroxylum novogranatense TaxID=1862640 RepID=A0AAV8SN10_9ROSI|nr:hypothetical protein K2173_019717 [Erythroxylum novogranatense]